MLTAVLTLLWTMGAGYVAPQANAAAIFEKAMAWADYVPGANAQRDAWTRNAGREVPVALVERLRKISSGLQILAVSEYSCSDSVNSIPYLGTLSTKAGVAMRVVDSHVGKPFMEAHRTPDGRAATPTVILIRNGKEVAAWVERPEVLQKWMIDIGPSLDQSERQPRKMSWYEWSRGDDALREIVALAEQTAKTADRQ